MKRFFSSRDQDVTLGFLMGFAGQVVTVKLIYTLFLRLPDYTTGLGWWIFSFFALEYWSWLGVAALWVLLVRTLLPEAGIWSPAVASVYAAVALSFMFHLSWLWAGLILGLGSLALGILLPLGTTRWSINPLIGLALIAIVVTLGLWG